MDSEKLKVVGSAVVSNFIGLVLLPGKLRKPIQYLNEEFDKSLAILSYPVECSAMFTQLHDKCYIFRGKNDLGHGHGSSIHC